VVGLATTSEDEEVSANRERDRESRGLYSPGAYRLGPNHCISVKNVEIVELVYPTGSLVPHASAKEVEFLANGGECVAAASGGDVSSRLGPAPCHRLSVEHAQILEHLVLSGLVVVVAAEDEHLLTNCCGSVVGARNGGDAFELGCGDVSPHAGVWVEDGEVEVGAMTIKTAEDKDAVAD